MPAASRVQSRSIAGITLRRLSVLLLLYAFTSLCRQSIAAIKSKLFENILKDREDRPNQIKSSSASRQQLVMSSQAHSYLLALFHQAGVYLRAFRDTNERVRR